MEQYKITIVKITTKDDNVHTETICELTMEDLTAEDVIKLKETIESLES